MRLIATVPMLVSLLALACASEEGVPANAVTKADAKTDAKAGTPPSPTPEIAPPLAEPEPEPKPDDFGGELCNTIIPCYQKLEFAGSFVADVTADIEPDGSVSAVSFTGEGPKPVQTCITDAIKATTLDPYNGKPGRVHCKKSGQLMGGTQMIMSEREYELRDAGAPTEAEADDAKAGDAKAG